MRVEIIAGIKGLGEEGMAASPIHPRCGPPSLPLQFSQWLCMLHLKGLFCLNQGETACDASGQEFGWLYTAQCMSRLSALKLELGTPQIISRLVTSVTSAIIFRKWHRRLVLASSKCPLTKSICPVIISCICLFVWNVLPNDPRAGGLYSRHLYCHSL